MFHNSRIKSVRSVPVDLPGLTGNPALLGFDDGSFDDKQLEEMAGTVVSIMNDELVKGLEKIQKQLDEKWEQGVSPADKLVKGLEDELEKKQTEVDALIKGHCDEMRLLKSEMNALGHGFTRPEGGPEDPMRVDYKGFVMKPDAMKAIVANYSGEDLGAVKKAIDTTDITSSGRLPAEVADRFIDLIVQEQQLLRWITTRRMLSPEARLDEMLVASRRLRLINEGVPPAGAFVEAENDGTPGIADGISFVARTLDTVEIIWAADITLSFLEDNIERANGEAHIADALARQFGTDLNDLAVNGDDSVTVTDADTAFRKTKNGFIALIEAAGVTNEQTFDPTGATTTTQVLRGMHKAILQRYKARTDYGYFVPTGFAEQYADEVQQRETGVGDSVLLNGFPNLRYFGRPVYPEPALANTTANAAKALLFPTQTAFFGIHRALRIDAEFKPRTRLVEYTMTTRIGYQFVGPQTWVRLSANIPAALL